MLDELPALIAAGYADVPEEDIVRLKWWGLYHDKPKVGTFMLRIKLPAGASRRRSCAPSASSRIEHGSRRGRAHDAAERPAPLPPARGAARRLRAPPRRRTDDRGRAAATPCATSRAAPSPGLAHDELFDATPVIDEATSFFYGNPDYSDLPRKHKITISALRATAATPPEINCISLDRGDPRRRARGSACWSAVGSRPCRASHATWVSSSGKRRPSRSAGAHRRLAEDLRYRVSRVKSRLKFMIDDIGTEGMRAPVEQRLGRRLPDFPLPHAEVAARPHGRRPRAAAGRRSIGIPVHLGLVSGTQMLALAELAEQSWRRRPA